jgi:hypothetical protein
LKDGAGAIGAGSWLWVFHRFMLGCCSECWLVNLRPAMLHPQIDAVDAVGLRLIEMQKEIFAA